MALNSDQHELNLEMRQSSNFRFYWFLVHDNRVENKIDESGHMCLDQIHLRKISNSFLKDMLYIPDENSSWFHYFDETLNPLIFLFVFIWRCYDIYYL